MSKDIENVKLAIQKKDISIERYSNQIKVFHDPKINALLEGILHNEIRHKAELEDHLSRLS
ncbi:MAG: hypothetical protein HUU09_05695 [Candidatus Jettenia caeni]|nr:hypothetical protein [Candidatus Jettenia caeni]UJS18576.1 MAG: hypothetical protein L3J17_05845 [Candidatus Jettenia sp.]